MNQTLTFTTIWSSFISHRKEDDGITQQIFMCLVFLKQGLHLASSTTKQLW
jgi:hypothetical protein